MEHVLLLPHSAQVVVCIFMYSVGKLHLSNLKVPSVGDVLFISAIHSPLAILAMYFRGSICEGSVVLSVVALYVGSLVGLHWTLLSLVTSPCLVQSLSGTGF